MEAYIALIVMGLALCDAKCLEGDCENGFGKRRDANGLFEGTFKDGKLHGQGTWTSPKKGYSGQWKDEKADGYGTLTWGQGKLGHGAGECTGQFKEDQMNGQASCTWPTGARYTGEFEKDQRHGWGTLDWLHQHYEGQWVHDQKLGKCKLFRWATGATYEGDWKVTGPEGIGTYRWPDGSFYTGSWQASKMHGSGQFHTATGEVHHHMFKHGHGHELHVKPGASKGWGQLLVEARHPLFLGLLALGALLAAAYFFCRRRARWAPAQGRYADLASPIGGEFQKLHVQVGADSAQAQV